MSFISKVINWIGGLFHKITDESRKLIPIVIDVVNQAKTIDGSEVGTIIWDKLLKNVQPELRPKIQAILIEVAKIATLGNACLQAGDDNAIVQCILAKINISAADTKKIYYRGFAQLLLEKISDGEISASDVVALLEYSYQHIDELAD